ncbi:MAG: hypothetical protein U0704_11855 [Candidatus Eisenbacteria bacterium]
MSEPTPAVSPQVAEIERHLKWSAFSTIAFIAILLVMTAMGVVSLTMKPRHPEGLGDDALAASVAARPTPARTTLNGLRWSAAVLGGDVGDGPADPPFSRYAATVREAAERAHAKHARDPRPLAALAALDVVAHDYARAAQRYRRACEAAPRYGEGRLGAGVALVLEADRTPEPWQSRALRLQAIAEFAMVDSMLPEYPHALYDRTLALRDVDRHADAAFFARRYLARESTGPHADVMRAIAAR